MQITQQIVYILVSFFFYIRIFMEFERFFFIFSKYRQLTNLGYLFQPDTEFFYIDFYIMKQKDSFRVIDCIKATYWHIFHVEATQKVRGHESVPESEGIARLT